MQSFYKKLRFFAGLQKKIFVKRLVNSTKNSATYCINKLSIDNFRFNKLTFVFLIHASCSM